jgi:hypothetical protein
MKDYVSQNLLHDNKNRCTLKLEKKKKPHVHTHTHTHTHTQIYTQDLEEVQDDVSTST